MNRKERRIYYKKMNKELQKIADNIVKYHNLYEGKDDKKLDNLVSEAIDTLSFAELTILTTYLESTIGNADS